MKTQKVHVPTTPFVTEVEVNFFTESYGTLSTQGRYLVKLIEYTVKFSISFSKSKAIRSVQVTKNGCLHTEFKDLSKWAFWALFLYSNFQMEHNLKVCKSLKQWNTFKPTNNLKLSNSGYQTLELNSQTLKLSNHL